MTTVGRFVDWFLRDRRTGRIVVAQWPNAPLWLFAAASIVARLAGPGSLGRGADWVATAALVWWAADEVLRGVNPWRRCLGAGVLAWLAYSRLG